MINQILKYPRTRHLEGSREQAGDEDLKCVSFEEIRGKFLVLEEKVDGANCGISFDTSGKMLLQSRGHYLNGGYGEKQFDLFKLWAGCFEDRLRHLLRDRYILYGEWLYAKHTVFYDRLPHYFMEFDIYDREERRFFSTRKRREFLAAAPFICSVRVLAEGYYSSVEEISAYIGKSAFLSEEKEQSFEKQCRRAGVRTEGPETDGFKRNHGGHLYQGGRGRLCDGPPEICAGIFSEYHTEFGEPLGEASNCGELSGRRCGSLRRRGGRCRQ